MARTWTVGLFGGAFWEVLDEPVRVLAETALFVLPPDEVAPKRERAAANRGKRVLRCANCGDDVFKRLELASRTEDEFIDDVCVLASEDLLKETLEKDPNAVPPRLADALKQYWEEVHHDEVKVGQDITLTGKMVEALNRGISHNICCQIAEKDCKLTERIADAKRKMIAAWHNGELVFGPHSYNPEDDSAATRFIRLTCKDCGTWNIVMPFGPFAVPAAWWINPHITCPDVVRVEFDAELKRPLLCILDGVVAEIHSTDRFIRDAQPEQTLERETVAGRYDVTTIIGPIALMADPVRNQDGSLDWEECEWRAEFASDKAFSTWLERRRANSVSPYATLCLAERRIRVADCGKYNERAYGILYRLENDLRTLLLRRVGEKHQATLGLEWWRSVLLKDLPGSAKDRLGKRGADPDTAEHLLEELTLPELNNLIHKYWSDLKDALGARDDFFHGLDLLIDRRNDIAHMRPLSKNDFMCLLTCSEKIRAHMRAADVP